ncbi:hypothetical protein GGTG_07180 [Gaeumannomyces tritici R3-111a-1]|uniref:Uncharacterized protein n=1 Tax=Gaeumannomyces tritici (strain R3-111a-1) TaxID=644352 RepID=J3P0Y4_GAET3|nr:hypothetical protein GGTG_07180 [Gaeumannomyces tritici R3-111a-1]EJT77268.1 hypothetical protein GGTG_07180 [Gaeumannomyces tritici R3-111a-1]
MSEWHRLQAPTPPEDEEQTKRNMAKGRERITRIESAPGSRPCPCEPEPYVGIHSTTKSSVHTCDHCRAPSHRQIYMFSHVNHVNSLSHKFNPPYSQTYRRDTKGRLCCTVTPLFCGKIGKVRGGINVPERNILKTLGEDGRKNSEDMQEQKWERRPTDDHRIQLCTRWRFSFTTGLRICTQLHVLLEEGYFWHLHASCARGPVLESDLAAPRPEVRPTKPVRLSGNTRATADSLSIASTGCIALKVEIFLSPSLFFLGGSAHAKLSSQYCAALNDDACSWQKIRAGGVLRSTSPQRHVVTPQE